ncbi:putative vesicle transport V-snare protein vti1a [Gonapodya prolifera JEL478]|uniref:Putative vesicle transport V-snare protein vti1a n=1 Tax=Gonapodya prolifera (strain JEL478) TaxID=1344416 RepID=A0A139AFP2_GONPJ|nr:putative vesicle transport V-snare protein vti1a [Gonapodya prolifera JEL478]|eukprot:KXS15631.1 putative vesicle transport V-snare protein vti1a [Gonapodya prolifera JEL478]
MANPSASAIFETYEREFQSLSHELSTKLAESIPQADSLDTKKQLLNQTDREIDEAEEIVSQMEMELLSLPQQIRVRLQPRVKAYKTELEKLRKDAKRLRSTLSSSFDRAALLSHPVPSPRPPSLDAAVADSDARARLLGGTARLEIASRRLDAAQRIALETEQVGVGTLGVLQQQREQILRTRDTLSNADGFIAQSQRVLKGMQRRMMTNKLITGAIVVVLVAMIILIIYLKWF